MSRVRITKRTSKTYNNKLIKLKSRYRRLFNSSKKLKESEELKNRTRPYFCDKYPKFEDFLKVLHLREVGKSESRHESSSSYSPSKRSVWGR